MLKKWWQKAVGYQIYPSSFKDSNNDGIGDLQGIISKLPYLEELGVNLLWICPFFKSPMVDNGYDIADYKQVDERFGTNDDLKELIKKAHQHNIKIIIDLVLNHTSDLHPWFQKALNNDPEYHDYYIWQKPKIVNNQKELPSNWLGFFSESVWEYVPALDEYYLHVFSKKMPDLNWTNPKVRQAMYQIAQQYLDLGIDGFRLDAISHLSKDMTFSDSELPTNEQGLVLDTSKFANREQIFEYLDEFKNEVLSKYDCMSIGEISGYATIDQALKFCNYQTGSLNMVFNFDTCWLNGAFNSIDKTDAEIKTDVIKLKQLFKKWFQGYQEQAWMPIYWLNHDHPRVVSQYGDINYRKESAKMLATTLLFMYGTPFIYQGEEIGMSNVDYQDLSDFKDVSALNFIQTNQKQYSKAQLIKFLKRTSRVNARTPFQWDDTDNAGFSKHTPLLKVNHNYLSVNVASEKKAQDSILNFYKQALKFRKEILNDVLDNPFTLIDENNPDVFAYDKKTYVVISNFRNYPVSFNYALNSNTIILHNYPTVTQKDAKIILQPFESLLILKKS